MFSLSLFPSRLLSRKLLLSFDFVSFCFVCYPRETKITKILSLLVRFSFLFVLDSIYLGSFISFAIHLFLAIILLFCFWFDLFFFLSPSSNPKLSFSNESLFTVKISIFFSFALSFKSEPKVLLFFSLSFHLSVVLAN